MRRWLYTLTNSLEQNPSKPLLKQKDGAFAVVGLSRETYSDATTGAYSLPEINQNVRYSAIAYDAYHDRRAVIADNLTPEIA